ncbi:MAG: hypothetical protein ACE5J3_08790 [Methanosarcinales archaeon]
MLSGICGINLKVLSTFEFLYKLYSANRLSASDFVDYFEDIEKKKLMHFKFPAQTMRDRYLIDVLVDFMRNLINQLEYSV